MSKVRCNHVTAAYSLFFAPSLQALPFSRHVAHYSARTVAHSPPRCARSHASQRSDPSDSAIPVIGCGGGGIFFFWQLGAARAVSEARRGKPTLWAGGSAGALCAALTLCAVSPTRAVYIAHTLAVRERLYSRGLQLAGVWGPLVREWLEELLPPDAAARCSQSLSVHITELRGWQPAMRRVREFVSRDALIDALMASVHIPFFLDGRLYATLRGPDGAPVRAVDGALLRFLPVRRAFGVRLHDLDIAFEPGCRPDFFITHTDDVQFLRSAPGFLELIGVETALEMVDRGFYFTKHRLRAGIKMVT